MTKKMHERLMSLFESHSSFDSLSTVMGSGASNTVRTINLDRRKDSKYRETTKSIGERFRLRKHSTGEMLEENASSSNAKQKKIYDLSKSLENALLTINKLNKRLSVLEHEKDELHEEVTWLRKFGCRPEQSTASRQSSVVSIEAGDDAIRLQLRQTIHELKLARLDTMKWKEERDTFANQCTQKEAKIAVLERDAQLARQRINSLEELVRRQLGELSLGDVVFNSDSASITSENKKSQEDVIEQSDTASSRVSLLSSTIDRPPSRGGPVRVVSAGRCRRDSTPKPDKITEDIDHLLGDLPSGLTLEPETATFDELKEKAILDESTKRYRQGSPRYYRSPSLTTDPPKHLPPLQKYQNKNVISLPRTNDKRPLTAAPMVERRTLLGRNASVPYMESRDESVEEVEDSADFLNIDDLLNAEETPVNIRSHSGKSRDSGFTDASIKTVAQ
ncbi:hypothetical protein PRIPAC_77521 [Pristionchus pacificus]|uniref:Uncharacterized protein n=1 Tax=Pristionchus pacificus TaxID=54126 RepID=A0A2A6C2F1_PRIPA|nr:hypothetical protein PRIPAC_77521 [Pristionchus pacificus]|eukprot:PDM72316.1 hypothetical protein PRIPAC_38750 [Pristionchus pacificus]